MSDTSTLTELAKFVGRSNLISETALARRRLTVNAMRQVQARPQRRTVTELLGAVLVLSARTRRMVMPYMTVDLDVFAPGGARAVRVVFGPRS